MTPIRLPADCLPGLLAPGLVLASGAVVVKIDEDRVLVARRRFGRGGQALFWVVRGDVVLFVDLRDPHVRDRVLRALAEAIVKGGGAHDCPEWREYRSPWRDAWRLAANDDTIRAWDAAGLPALASVPLDSPDRDLLALRVVCLAVGGAR